MPLCLSMELNSSRGEAAGPHVALGLLERFNRPNILMIALPQPAKHPADKRREHVEAQIEFVHLSHLMIGRSAKSIDTAIGEVGSGILRFFNEFADARTLIKLRDATALRIGSVKKHHGH